ncbi:hypothetical protein Nepgr_009758 [Nepenthes gracilis]|uniref:Elongator complex protein 6 n=1 Tax=Nepenthes gracilis TaxID=150966 RepID=A0AAD3XKF8_NEPGR|nr:hypothetical protein Nepgr_009758 [Nepenthes gracilis]
MSSPSIGARRRRPVDWGQASLNLTRAENQTPFQRWRFDLEGREGFAQKRKTNEEYCLVLTNNHSGTTLLNIGGRVLLIEDCIETSAAFVIYHIVKCSLSSPRSSGVVIFVALSHPFSHYDRVLRKLGCNLAVHRDNKRFIFFDMLMLECQGGNDGNVTKDGLVELFGKIQKEVEVISSKQESERYVMVIIDDFSLIEAAVNGTSNHGSDFLHYCRTLTSEFGSSLVILNHEDIYLGPERPLILQMEYFADILIKAQPLATGVAADVHGQLTVINRNSRHLLKNSITSFQFKLNENGIECFFPGTRT